MICSIAVVFQALMKDNLRPCDLKRFKHNRVYVSAQSNTVFERAAWIYISTRTRWCVHAKITLPDVMTRWSSALADVLCPVPWPQPALRFALKVLLIFHYKIQPAIAAFFKLLRRASAYGQGFLYCFFKAYFRPFLGFSSNLSNF